VIWRWAIAASLIWAITGANAGMHLAVAPVTLPYRTCLETAPETQCLAELRREWPNYSDDRIRYALLIGLTPVVIGWALGAAVLRSRRSLGGARWRKHATTFGTLV
jgi:hypothetical protein